MYLVGGFLDLVSAAWIDWFNAILFATLLVLELFFMPETLYPRNLMLQKMPKEESFSNDIEKHPGKSTQRGETPAEMFTELKRTKTLFFINYRPIPGICHPKPWDSITRFIITFRYPVVTISILGYCFLWYWWVLSVITMVPAAYANYSPLIQGLLFLGLFLGTLFSEIFFSGSLSDYIVARLAKKNGGVRTAEMRLWLAYPAIILTTGQSLIQSSIKQNTYFFYSGIDSLGYQH